MTQIYFILFSKNIVRIKILSVDLDQQTTCLFNQNTRIYDIHVNMSNHNNTRYLIFLQRFACCTLCRLQEVLTEFLIVTGVIG